MAKLLIELGADVNAKIQDETPLVLAVENNFYGMVQLLVKKKGADINVKDEYDKTPLYLAYRLEFSEIQQFLLSKGAEE